MYSIHAFAAIARRRVGDSRTELLSPEEKKTAPAERLKIQGSARILGVRFEFVLDVDLCEAASAPAARRFSEPRH
jgi:hypothetical protein